jgi:hypothetical protein
MLLGLFWGVFGDFWARNRHLFSFFGVASLLREGVGVLEITPHLLNVSVLGTRHLWRVPRNALFDAFILLFSGLCPRPPIWGLEGSRVPVA